MEEKPRLGRTAKPAVDFIARNKAKVKEIARNRSQSKDPEDQENAHKPSRPHFKPKKAHPAKGLSEPLANPAVTEPAEQKEEVTKTATEEPEVVAETAVVPTEEVNAESSAPVESHSEAVPAVLCPTPSLIQLVPFSSPPPHSPTLSLNSAPQPSLRPLSPGDLMVLSNPQPASSELVIVDPCPKRSRESTDQASTTQLSPKRFKRLSQHDHQS